MIFDLFNGIFKSSKMRKRFWICSKSETGFKILSFRFQAVSSILLYL